MEHIIRRWKQVRLCVSISDQPPIFLLEPQDSETLIVPPSVTRPFLIQSYSVRRMTVTPHKDYCFTPQWFNVTLVHAKLR